jgi:hypothetical protein
MESRFSIKMNFVPIKIERQMDNTRNESFSSNVFLTGTIILATLDVAGLLDYAVKAGIGGGIWLGYKLLGDYMEKRKEKMKQAETND